MRLAEELRRTVTEHPFIRQTRSFSIGVSIGLVNLGNEPLTLAEMLSAADSDEINMELSTPTKAGIIKPSDKDENEELLMLVMPLMLNQ